MKDEKVSPNDPLQSIYVHKLKVGEHEDSNGDRKYTFYRVTVKNDAKATGVVESWAKPGGFDDLAFGNAISDNKQVMVKKVKKTS